MFKKLIVGGVVVGTLFALVAFGPRPFSYARTWVASWKKSAEDSVPLDIKIKHAREEVAKLGPDVRKCMHVIAEQQVDVENLQARIADRRSQLKSEEAAIHKLRNDLKTGDTEFVYAGRTYRASEVRRDLALRFDRFRTFEEAVQRDEKILTAKQTALIANESRLDEMMGARKQLEVQIEQLEARWKTLQAAQTTSDLEFDDSHLSKTKTLIKKLSKELDVRDKMLTAEGKMGGGLIPVNKQPREIPVNDVTKSIDDFFAKRDGKSSKSVKRNGTPVVKTGKSGTGL